MPLGAEAPPRYSPEAETIYVAGPQDTQVDFQLWFWHNIAVSPWMVNTVEGATLSVEMYTRLWEPQQACGHAQLWDDGPIGDPIPMTTADSDPDAKQTWTAEIVLPVGLGEMNGFVKAWATECDTGAQLTDPDYTYHYLVVDNTAPVVSDPQPGPEVWLNGDPRTFSVEAREFVCSTAKGSYFRIDGDDVAFTETRFYPQRFEMTETVTLAEGEHLIEVGAADCAGNVGTFSWTARVDTTAPTTGAALPADGAIVDTASPRLAVPAADGLAGLDVARATLTLSNGVVVDTVTPQWDPAEGELWWQIPDTIEGTALTHRPLADGHYSATVTAYDHADNATAQTWGFTVNTLGPLTSP